MARVHHRKARKDYPADGIKKGDMYYYAKVKTGPRSSRTIRSLTQPRPSQLTSSEFLGALGDMQEGFAAIQDIDGLNQVAEQLRELGQEQQEKHDNMPEGLQQGDVGQLLEERANGCEEWADSVEEAVGEYESRCAEIDESSADDLNLDDEVTDADLQEAREAAKDEAFGEFKEQAESACPF